MKISRCLFSCLVLAFVMMATFSCNNFKGSQEIPAYIHVDTFLLTTNYPIEGAASHKITDVWLYIDDNLLGCYEMPATIPILERGKHKVTLYPGIKLNGISSTRTINPFYQPYIVDNVELKEREIDTLCPSTTYYSLNDSDINFRFIEDFERQVMLEETSSSDTTITRTERDALGIWNDAYNTSHYSGYVWLGVDGNDTIDNFCITSEAYYDLPDQGNSIFLEIDYKTNETFEVGLFAYISGEEYMPLVYVNPSPTKWNKIYINLGPNITDTQEAQYFKFYIAGRVDAGEEAEFYFDNIKFVYRE